MGRPLKGCRSKMTVVGRQRKGQEEGRSKDKGERHKGKAERGEVILKDMGKM